ncbi:MAG: hypothetical protein IT323_22430 [Anaerolineae bacterium]|nr:hypothetical protein [Anaerolineae bacterium]
MSPDHESQANGQASASPSSVESLQGGGSLEWLADRHIVSFYTPDSSQAVLRGLFERAEEIIHGWPADRPMLMILDISGPRVGMTPFARERGRAMMVIRPGLSMALAMVVSRTLQAQIYQVMIRLWQRSGRQIAVVFSHDDAVAWLKTVGGIE